MDNRQNSDAFKTRVKQFRQSFIPQNAEEALHLSRSSSPESRPKSQLNVENVSPSATTSQGTKGPQNVHTREMSWSPSESLADLYGVLPDTCPFPGPHMALLPSIRVVPLPRAESPPDSTLHVEFVSPPSPMRNAIEIYEGRISPLEMQTFASFAPSSDRELANLLFMEETRRHRYIALVCSTASSTAASWGTPKKFSERFSALWGDLEDRTGTVWFCIMDGEHTVFALRSTSCKEVGETEEVRRRFPHSEISAKSTKPGQSSAEITIKCLNLPNRTITWTTVLQSAADFMDTDNQIRAVLTACIVSTRAEGGKSCVSDAIIPEIPHVTRYLSTLVNYDVPVDYDLMTALATPVNINNELYFKCGLGTLAKAVGHESIICHLERIVDNQKLSNLAEQQQHLVVPYRLPILYGFGKFLDTDNPRATTQIDDILRCLSLTSQRGNVSRILRAIVKVAPELNSTGKLDLSAAAGVLFDSPGVILGTRKTRKIRGDVLLIGPDGIYRSSRFRGIAVEGSLEVNLALIKLGMRASRPVDTKKDKRISFLSEIAEHILDRDYKFKHHCDMTQDFVKGPADLWSDETATCNTLVAFLCRKFGTFTGFSGAVSTSGFVRVSEPKRMEANIFLPALKVWQHAPDLPDRRIWFARWEPLSSKIVICGCFTENCDTPPNGIACVNTSEDLTACDRAPHVVVHGALYRPRLSKLSDISPDSVKIITTA